MSEAPINREKQIQFMKEAAKRRAERHKRWSGSAQLKAVLREPAPVRNVTDSYARSDLQHRKFA